ncbi:hypothetical protein GCAAIG_08190 [Candidatus Electronema halotolerans]
MKKILSLALAASLTSIFCPQSSAWSKSSLLLQIPAILAKPQGGTTTVNDNVTVIDENSAAEIVSSNTSAEGDTELQLSGNLASSTQDGSILYLLSGADDRFPFGIAGKVVSTTSNADGTKTVVLGEATYADIVKEASFNLDNIVLDASNFVGVIAPAAVEAASPMSAALAKSVSDGSVYSFRDGAVVVRRTVDKSRAMSSASESGTIDAGTVSLNMKVDLGKIIDGVEASTMKPININTPVGFVISGSLKNIKITNENEFSLLKGGLKYLNLRLDGDLDFDVKFNGKGAVKFGYFSQAWNEVKDESFKMLGVKAKLNGLSSDDKIGKYPLAGLVWSVPCPETCPVLTGKTQTPLRQAKALGVIVWLYLTAEGEFSLDGNFTLAHLTPAGLSVGIKKTYGNDFNIINSLTKKSASDCLIESPELDGKAGLQVKAGITTDLDFLAGGVRIANAGMDVVGLFKAQATGKAGYCINNLGESGSWNGEICFSGGLGAGLIARAAAKVGIEIDTTWKDVSLNLEYSKQTPAKEDIDKEGRHGLWYYKSFTLLSTLNDTGITWSGNYESGNNTACIASSTPDGDNVVAAQDCSHGRDATHNDDSDGDAGFSYTKLNSDGKPLANQNADYATTPWACVKDNVTGLIWEVKTDDGGLHDKDDEYTWYNTDPKTNGGSNGYDAGDNCYGYDSSDSSTFCNTQAYVNRVNAAGWCGASDWRMPTRKELENLVHHGRIDPAIDIDYFPNTRSWYYWSGVPNAYDRDGQERVWTGDFVDGDGGTFNRFVDLPVRLVHNGQCNK